MGGWVEMMDCDGNREYERACACDYRNGQPTELVDGPLGGLHVEHLHGRHRLSF